MKFLVLVIPLSSYNCWSTRKTFWDANVTPVNMRSCGHCSVRKNKEIKNGENYIDLGIYLQIECVGKREVTSSGSRYYVLISVKGKTNSLTLRTRRSSNKKHKASTSNTDVVSQYFIKLFEEFNDFPYL